METSGKDDEKLEKRPRSINKNKDDHNHYNYNQLDPSLFVGDILALTLIASMMTLQNINIEMSIRRERNRIVKEKSSLGVLLNQLIFELEEELNSKLFEQSPGSAKKVEEIKLEIEQCELKIGSLGEYAKKLDRALKLLKENPRVSTEKSSYQEEMSTKGKIRNDKRGTAMGSTPSLSSYSSSTSSSSNISERRNRVKEWRKVASMKQDVSTWKIITPAIVQSRQQLDQLTNQLNTEICRQMNSGRSPTRAVLRKIKNLEQSIEECEEEIKVEEERAVNIYKTAIISKDTKIRLRMCTKGRIGEL